MVKFLNLTVLCLSLFLIGVKAKLKTKNETYTPAYSGYSVEWLKNKTKEYPELLWLADEDVYVTEENVGISSEYSPSCILFESFYPEFDRTALTLKAFETFYQGKYRDYLLFTSKQDPQFRLKYRTFLDIQKYFRETLEALKLSSKKSVINLLECLIIFSDLGKSRTARKIARDAGIRERDLDLFFHRVASKNPGLFPSFNLMQQDAKKVLLQLSCQAHFGHIAHCEGGLELFENLEEANFLDNPLLFDIAFIAHICDVAGAQGHVEPCSSVNYTETTHQLLKDVQDACWNIKSHGAKTAWGHFLEKRAKALGLGTEGVLNHIILRLSSMMRFTNSYEATCLKQALFELPQQELEMIRDAFSWENKIATKYVPAVMLNLVRNPSGGRSHSKRIREAVHIGLPFLATTIQSNKKKKQPFEMTLNFNPIAKIAKENPQLLLDCKAKIDQKGVVYVSQKSS